MIGKGNEAATTINQFNGYTKVPGKAEGKEHRNTKNNCNTCVKEGRSEWKMESSTATGTSSSWLTLIVKKLYILGIPIPSFHLMPLVSEIYHPKQSQHFRNCV